MTLGGSGGIVRIALPLRRYLHFEGRRGSDSALFRSFFGDISQNPSRGTLFALFGDFGSPLGSTLGTVWALFGDFFEVLIFGRFWVRGRRQGAVP